jgi:type II secretory pathway component PulF
MAGRIGLKSMALFSKQAAVSLNAGLTLSRAIPVITKGSRDPSLRRAMEEITDDIAGGHTLNEAVRRRAHRFPLIFVEMVDAGERTGHLPEIFQRLADYFDMRLRIRRSVIRASIYPAIQLGFAFGVICLFLVISATTSLSIGSSSSQALIVSGMVGMVVGSLATVVFFSWTAVGRSIWDRVVLMLPVFRSLTIKLCMVRFTRTLAMQLESAIPVAEAVERSASVAGNSVIVKSLKAMGEHIRQGSSLAEAITNSRFVTPMIREVIAVSEETGSFGESLNRIADIYEDEATLVLETVPKFIGLPVLILVGLIVIYLFYTIYIGNYINMISG